MCHRYLDTSTILRLLDGHIKLKLHEAADTSVRVHLPGCHPVGSGSVREGSPHLCVFVFFFIEVPTEELSTDTLLTAMKPLTERWLGSVSDSLLTFPLSAFQTAILPLPGLHSAPCLQFKACSVLLLTQVDLFLNFDF